MKTIEKILYFDNAATTPVHPEVITTIADTLTNIYGNPSSLHSIGQKAKQILMNSRNIIANHINCKPNEIIFTSGACEANSLAIRGYMDCHKNTTLITTRIEHKSITSLCENENYDIRYVSVDKYGCVNLDDLDRICKELSNEKTSILVSIQSANSEIGTIQDIKKIGDIVHKYNGVFHTDATQLFPYQKINVNSLKIDMLSMSGQKINAPKGIGFLYVKEGIKLKPLIYGSQMEFRRGGTENIPYITGLAKAIELLDYDNRNMKNMQYYLFSQLSDMEFDYRANGYMLNRLPNNINISFKGIEGESLIILLDCNNICVSTISACNSISLKPSTVLKEIGVPEDYIHGTIRITLPHDVTKADVNYFLDILKESVTKLESMVRD